MGFNVIIIIVVISLIMDKFIIIKEDRVEMVIKDQLLLFNHSISNSISQIIVVLWVINEITFLLHINVDFLIYSFILILLDVIYNLLVL